MNLPVIENRGKPRLHSVMKTSIIIFLFLAGAKLLNFLKKILIGKLFGVSFVADAFFAASFLPYYLGILFEGILFLGFLPLFARVMAERGKEEANQFVVQTFLMISVLISLIVAISWWKAPWIIAQLVPGFSVSEQSLTQSLFLILSLVFVFTTLTLFFKALNSYFGDYALAASSGLTDALVMIVVMLLGWKVLGIYGAAWGAVLGVVIAFIAQAIFLFRRHLIFDWQFYFRSPLAAKFFYFVVPMGIVWFFQQIPLMILNRFGSGMWEGTISALTISQTITTVPMAFVNQTVLLAIFPFMARQLQEKSSNNIQDTFFKTLRGSFFILVPLGFLLSALAKPITVLFFAGGGISMEGTRRVANTLTWFGWATFALYADLFMTQSLITIRKNKTAISLCGIRAVLSYVLSYLLSSLWDYQGLALAFSISLVVNFFLFFPVFFKKSPFIGKWKDLFTYTFVLILATSPVLSLAWFLNHWSIQEWLSFPVFYILAGMFLACLAALASYALCLYLFGIKEIRAVFEALKQGWMKYASKR